MIKRQQAFTGEGMLLKGNLHCHTTHSDGHMTPAEVMEFLAGKGYDFLAITDHRRYNFENEAPEYGITIIPGMEFDCEFERGYGMRCFHTVCIGPSREDGNGFEQGVRLPSGRYKDQLEYQEFLDEAHAKNNLTIYCHPEWSSTPARYFEKQKGNFAMEIYNTACDYECDMDKDAAYWDELLAQGIKIFGVASDDAHWQGTLGGGWVMVKAENNVNSILDSLKCGKFYSSCGPEILDFYIDGEKAYIDCSKAKRIRLHSANHPTLYIDADGDGMTHAEFNLKWWAGPYQYVRASVIDADGKKAWTNPIYLCEEGEE